MSSKRRHEGYVIIDHRAGPGVPGEMARFVGLPEKELRGGQVFESATITCSHCCAVVILNPDRQRPRGYCRKCDHYVCDKPECALECTPWGAIRDALDKVASHTDGTLIVPEQPNLILSNPQLLKVVPNEGEKENKDGQEKL